MRFCGELFLKKSLFSAFVGMDALQYFLETVPSKKAFVWIREFIDDFEYFL